MERHPLRLLAVCPYAIYPPVGGGKLRIFHLLREWMALGHEVVIWVQPSDEPDVPWPDREARPRIEALPAKIRRSLQSKVSSLLSTLPEEAWARPVCLNRAGEHLENFDVVLLMQGHVGRYAQPFVDAGVPVILDQQNVEADISRQIAHLAPTRLGRARARLDVLKWNRFERKLLQQVQMTVAVSEADASRFRELLPKGPVVVRPSGADLRSLEYVDHSENRGDRLIMTGTLGYLPNLDAATWMISRILPLIRRARPDAHLVLVGANAPPALLEQGTDGVQVVGRVPDVEPHLRDADLFVAPLRAGGGTRLKLLEAFAVGLPTVATTLASAGISAQPGIHVAIADTEQAFADEVVRMLQSRSARDAMAKSARKLVEDQYDWRSIALDYQEDLYALSASRTQPL